MVTFQVTHEGRGGRIVATDEGVSVVIAIDMVDAGRFSVHLRGAKMIGDDGRARPVGRNVRGGLRTQLRAWLDDTDRATWAIEG